MIQIPFRWAWLLAIALLGTGNDSSGQETRQSQPKPKESLTKPDFVDLFNGNDLKGIQVLNKSYFEDHGKVLVKKNELVLSKGEPGTGIAIDPKVHKDLPRMDYEVFITAKRIDGGDFFCGLTFPVNKSYCTLILGGWGGGAIGLSNVDTLSAIENETSGFHEFENNRWYDIHLVVSDKSLKATLKETGKKEAKVLFDIVPGDHKFDIWWEQEPARPLGITTWNTTAAFKQIRIQKLKTDKKK